MARLQEAVVHAQVMARLQEAAEQTRIREDAPGGYFFTLKEEMRAEEKEKQQKLKEAMRAEVM